jgi:hypothetical protein
MLLENKNAIIYGAAGAVGGAVARAFAREGAGYFSPDETPTHSPSSPKRSRRPVGWPRPARLMLSTNRPWQVMSTPLSRKRELSTCRSMPLVFRSKELRDPAHRLRSDLLLPGKAPQHSVADQ